MDAVQVELIKEFILTIIVIVAGLLVVYPIAETKKHTVFVTVITIYSMFASLMILRLFVIIILAQF